MTSHRLLHLIVTAAITAGIGISSAVAVEDTPEQLTADQEELVIWAFGRFEAQGLSLPDVEVVFHDSLEPCQQHKGVYRASRRLLEMCTLDQRTMLHELAHAWAGDNLDSDDRARFVAASGLDGWNDPETPWDQRGTEHVAETIAWGLSDEPHLVRYVETTATGVQDATNRLLSIGVDVDKLFEDFELLVGSPSVFRNRSEWPADSPAPVFSPEGLRTP